MCGITGWIDFTRNLGLERTTLEAMTGSMHRRGPDDSGIWLGPHVALGHRRLAVVDPAGGAQPMETQRRGSDAPVVLTYSGELYNFRELRAELTGRNHRFRTSSDTEVVLHAYLEWGAGFVDRLQGIYAFAIWDAWREELILVRDRLGVKPLYYHAYQGGLLFGSEPKAILANPLFTARTSEAKLPILFNPRLAMPWETPFTDMRQVQPGHLVRVDRSGAHETPYWRLVSREHRDDYPTTVSRVREILEDVVAHQMVADVPLCSLLSGGLDSSAITALAARNRPDALRSYSVDFEGAEEDFRATALRPERDTPFALAAARHLGVDHTMVTLDPAVLPDYVPATLAARDMPSLGQFDTSMYLLFQEIRKTSTVALSGEAGDEVFGGYPWFFDRASVFGDTFPWLGNAPRLTDCLAPDVTARIRPQDDEQDRYRTLLSRVPRLPGESGLEARMREVLHLSLQGPLLYLLDRKDRMSMAVGLEVRVPFCDHTLLEYVWNVPWKMKVSDGREKSLLRSATEDLLPQSVLMRRKSGYPATFAPAHAEAQRAALDALVADRDSPLAGMLDGAKVRELAYGDTKMLTMADNLHFLLPLIEVDRWLRTYNVSFTD
ncbi:asparagine synthase (glutamine-hydrolyzing) [Streptomyces sp. NBC_00378]|uniref:asparagine synthase (glutamine-hydrolyzing) n=1 Tax=unclassified Streptomyces TaxID=2593676 RepID=UPI0022507801|nr:MULTISPECIES: asparagine synthase (glutamine-hydrolyzing) [unclassified Streptomyces]MCX5113557.1 asparagine synthase (glutamine-hydrolyzing) [Streptomyces sp. NBC_00378]